MTKKNASDTINYLQRRTTMSLHNKNEMNMNAANQFWSWFQKNEQWIIEEIHKCPVKVVKGIRIHLMPIFPYYNRLLEFELGFGNGRGEFFLFHCGNSKLNADGQKLQALMPIGLRKNWNFYVEK